MTSDCQLFAYNSRNLNNKKLSASLTPEKLHAAKVTITSTAQSLHVDGILKIGHMVAPERIRIDRFIKRLLLFPPAVAADTSPMAVLLPAGYPRILLGSSSNDAI